MSETGPSEQFFETGGGTQPAAEPQTSEFATGFLSRIPEADREVVGRYVKDWDRGVQSRFEQIRDEFRPFKELGVDYPTLTNALQVFQMLNDEAGARQIRDNLVEYFNNLEGEQQQQAAKNADMFQGMSPEFQKEWEQMKQFVLNSGQVLVQDRQARQEAQEDQDLQDYMAELHKNHGDFDDEFVLVKMGAGYDGPDAVAAYQQFLQNHTGSLRPMVRPISGGGAVSNGGFDPKKASGQDVRNMVANLLAQAAQEDQR